MVPDNRAPPLGVGPGEHRRSRPARGAAGPRPPLADRAPHVCGRPGAKSLVDDLILGQGFVRSRAAPSLRSIESQPSIQAFVGDGMARASLRLLPGAGGSASPRGAGHHHHHARVPQAGPGCRGVVEGRSDGGLVPSREKTDKTQERREGGGEEEKEEEEEKEQGGGETHKCRRTTRGARLSLTGPTLVVARTKEGTTRGTWSLWAGHEGTLGPGGGVLKGGCAGPGRCAGLPALGGRGGREGTFARRAGGVPAGGLRADGEEGGGGGGAFPDG